MTAKDLYEHLQSHSQTFMGKTSPCEICGKLLKNKYSLKVRKKLFIIGIIFIIFLNIALIGQNDSMDVLLLEEFLLYRH